MQCHLLHIKLMSIKNNRSCLWWSGLYILDEPAASYLSSAKVPIDWSANCASVSPPVQPLLGPLPLPPSLPSISPSSYPCPRPHWSPCPGSCPQITQLDVFCVWVKWINYQDNRSGNHKARKSPWIQQRDRTEERRQGWQTWKQMAERREWLWFGGNKRDVFRRIFSRFLLRRWGFLEKHGCKNCECPVRG